MRLLPRPRSRAAGVALRAWGLLLRVDPTAARSARWARRAELALLVTVVYRRANAAGVAELLRDVVGVPSARVVLWALDEPAGSLAAWTLGSGPGGRLALHQRMAASVDDAAQRFWVVSDDDVRLPRGGAARLAAVMQRGGIDVAGAAHAASSQWSHSFTLARPLSVARLSAFVETGPVVAFSPRAQRTLLPLPETSPAGWGMEAYWSSRTHPSLRSAVVDAVAVDHLVPMGTSYDADAEWERCRAFTRRYGVEDVSHLKTTLATWRPWQERPPWRTR